MMLNRFVLFLLITMSMGACVKDKPSGSHPTNPPANRKGGIYIVNEGSLGNNNSSLSYFDPATQQAYEDVFKAANNRSLGDVFQSMTLIDGNFWLAINNSDKIEVIDTGDLKSRHIIALQKPRYILQVSADKAYVTSLFNPIIHIVNTKTFQVTGSITTDYANTEDLVMLNGKVYVSQWDTAANFVYEINPGTDQIERRITFNGRASSGLAVDKNHKLWVMAGNVTKGKTATLSRIDPVSGTVEQSFTFGPKEDPIRLRFNATGDSVYWIGVDYYGTNAYNGIYRMPVTATQLPAQPFITAQQFQYFWGLDIDPVTNDIYITDPKGFIQKGTVLKYNAAGQLLGNFATGTGPSACYFFYP